jgi:AcrR family transcriptional regulator
VLREKKKTQTHGVILDATDRLLAPRGYRSLTIDDIAAEAGVSRRTIYMYFRSKEEVGLSSVDRVVEATFGHLEQIVAAGGDPKSVVVTMLVERVLHRVASVYTYRASLDELFEAVRPAYMARRARHFEREVALFAGVLASGRAAGCFAFDKTNRGENNDATSRAPRPRPPCQRSARRPFGLRRG